MIRISVERWFTNRVSLSRQLTVIVGKKGASVKQDMTTVAVPAI
jgi:hypothetical protein